MPEVLTDRAPSASPSAPARRRAGLGEALRWSASRALERAARDAGIACRVEVTADAAAVAGADRLLVAGQGAAGAAMAALDALRTRLPVDVGAVRRGLVETALPGRFQVLPGRPACPSPSRRATTRTPRKPTKRNDPLPR